MDFDYDVENTIEWELSKIKAIGMVMECCNWPLEPKIAGPIGEVILDHVKKVNDHIAIILKNKQVESNPHNFTVEDIEPESKKLISLIRLLDFSKIGSVDPDILHRYCESMIDVTAKISSYISSHKELLIQQED